MQTRKSPIVRRGGMSVMAGVGVLSVERVVLYVRLNESGPGEWWNSTCLVCGSMNI
jgi:F0F1-type ATP synthase beta subunit